MKAITGRAMAFALLAAMPVLTTATMATPARAATAMTAEEKAAVAKIEAIRDSLTPQTGDIALPEAKATLHLGQDYYFLGPVDARKILVDAWKNPPSAADKVLGMVFEKGRNFYDATAWGAVVTFEPSGYVTDDDARTADYADLLKQMQASQEEANGARKEQGYAPLHLIGWAQQPTYDAASHSVIWAQNLRADGDAQNGLNYDVRLLGRVGVLSLNMLSTMDDLAGVNRAAAKLARAATFDSGARYADYIPDVDKKAGYGIAGLVATGVGIAAAKKLGFLAIALGLGKKLFVLVAVAGAAIVRFAKRLFGRKTDADADSGDI